MFRPANFQGGPGRRFALCLAKEGGYNPRPRTRPGQDTPLRAKVTPTMTRTLQAILAIGMMLALADCGQKGPLQRPGAASLAPAAAIESPLVAG